MSDAHRLVAEIVLALALLAAAWALVLTFSRRAPGRFFLVNLGWVVLGTVVTAALGVWLLITGPAPRDPLHLLYGALALVAVPTVIFVASRRPAQQQALVMLIGAVVLLIIVLRLFQTGAA